MTDLQEKIKDTATSWLNAKLDGVIEANPRLSVFSKHIRRGLTRKIDEMVPKLEGIMPFITDDDGKLDIGSISTELLNAFDEMPVKTYSLLGIDIKIGKGVATASIPSNVLTDLIFDNGCITLTRADIEELLTELDNIPQAQQ